MASSNNASVEQEREICARGSASPCVAAKVETDIASWKSALPHESVPLLLELLSTHSLAQFRRSCRLHNFAKEASIAELRSLVLDLLQLTKFPFTHAAFVLGLNGPYYSYDTTAANHYGIPEALAPALCRFFRLSCPGVPFTTVRMQKLAASANFGGQHRTLAFSLAAPNQEFPADEWNTADKLCSDTPAIANSMGYALFLTPGCHGGRGEVCNDVLMDPWRVLIEPTRSPHWEPFPRSAWLQWHWPLSGDLYAVTVTCEPPVHRGLLTTRERRCMLSMGFLLPDTEHADAANTGDAADSLSEHGAQDEDDGVASTPCSPIRRSLAALEAARQIFGYSDDARPTLHEIEESFRQIVRVVHPDRAGDHATPDLGSLVNEASSGGSLAARTRGWAMSRITWARKVLREASTFGWWEGTMQEQVNTERVGGDQPVLMLAAPPSEAEPNTGDDDSEHADSD